MSMPSGDCRGRKAPRAVHLDWSICAECSEKSHREFFLLRMFFPLDTLHRHELEKEKKGEKERKCKCTAKERRPEGIRNIAGFCSLRPREMCRLYIFFFRRPNSINSRLIIAQIFRQRRLLRIPQSWKLNSSRRFRSRWQSVPFPACRALPS